VESVVEADNQVGAVLVPLAKKKASATKANTAVDVRVASCGANSTAMLTRTEGPLLCGRSSVLCDAVSKCASKQAHERDCLCCQAGTTTKSVKSETKDFLFEERCI